MTTALVAELRGMSVGGPSPSDPEGPDTITFELEATAAKDARLLAQHLVEKMRAIAGLPRRREPAPVVWVAPMAEGWASSQRFLGVARDLLDNESYEMAVLAAQVHLELQIGILVRQAVAASGSPVVEKLLEGQRGWAPHDRWGGPVIEALLGVNVTDFPRWSDYRAHISRRNAIAHAGQPVEEEEAKASLAVVTDLWLWLNASASP